jgi:hypothetical protein
LDSFFVQAGGPDEAQDSDAGTQARPDVAGQDGSGRVETGRDSGLRPRRVREGKGASDDLPYRTTKAGLFLRTGSPGSERRLTNFQARIVEDHALDDGGEASRLFVIEARWKGRCERIRVPAATFATLGWVTERLGAGAIIYPGYGARDHVRAAIQAVSGDVPETRVYAHTGWRKHRGRWLFLHADGALGAQGAVPGLKVSLPADL